MTAQMPVSKLASMAATVLAVAQSRGIAIATAESCTAGCLATLLADAPGGGNSLHGGIVVYTKMAKTAMLGVPSEMLSVYTAVSQPVAERMAQGLLKRSPAQLAIAITGVAGPEPDDDNNPVGLVHVAVAYRGRGTWHRKHTFSPDDRSAIRSAAMEAALQLTQECFADSSV